MKFQTINPATGAVVATYESASPEARQTIIASAHQAYLAWRHTNFRERATLMRRAAEVLRENAVEYARLMAEGIRDLRHLSDEAALVIDQAVAIIEAEFG